MLIGIWILFIAVTLLYFWLFGEHLVENYMGGDWAVLRADWMLSILLLVFAGESAFYTLKLAAKLLLWAAGLPA